MQMTAKAENPAEMNSKIASKNRRRSNDTLPPWSLAYAFIALFMLTWRVHSQWLSNLIVTDDRQSC